MASGISIFGGYTVSSWARSIGVGGAAGAPNGTAGSSQTTRTV